MLERGTRERRRSRGGRGEEFELRCVCGASFRCRGTENCPWSCPWRDRCYETFPSGGVGLRGLPLGLFRAGCPTCGSDLWYRSSGIPAGSTSEIGTS